MATVTASVVGVADEPKLDAVDADASVLAHLINVPVPRHDLDVVR